MMCDMTAVFHPSSRGNAWEGGCLKQPYCQTIFTNSRRMVANKRRVREDTQENERDRMSERGC